MRGYDSFVGRPREDTNKESTECGREERDIEGNPRHTQNTLLGGVRTKRATRHCPRRPRSSWTPHQPFKGLTRAGLGATLFPRGHVFGRHPITFSSLQKLNDYPWPQPCPWGVVASGRKKAPIRGKQSLQGGLLVTYSENKIPRNAGGTAAHRTHHCGFPTKSFLHPCLTQDILPFSTRR